MQWKLVVIAIITHSKKKNSSISWISWL